MHAILHTGNWGHLLTPKLSDTPDLLLPVLDKPWLIHVIERLVHGGATTLHVLADEVPPQVRAVLGDGSRWGVALTVGAGLNAAEAPAILADVRAIPTGSATSPLPRDSGAPWIYLSDLGSKQLVWRKFFKSLPAREVSVAPPNPRFLNLRSWADYLHADHPRFLRLVPEALIAGREVEPGIILCRNVELHPSARVIPPVFLGEDVRIGRRATVGPNAVVHRASIVSGDSEIIGAIVLPETFVGEDLDLRNMIALPSKLWSAEMQIEVPIADAFIIGDLRRNSGGAGGMRRMLTTAWQAMGLRQTG